MVENDAPETSNGDADIQAGSDVDMVPQETVDDILNDPEDPDVLKAKLAEMDKKLKTMDKRYRDVQSWRDKTENEKKAILSKMEEHGLEYAEGDIKKKKLDIDDGNYDRTKFQTDAATDAAGAVEKLVQASVRKALEESNLKRQRDENLRVALEDKKLVESIPGYSEVAGRVADIIRDQNLAFSKNPFSTALLLLDDPALSDKVRERLNSSVRGRDAEKRAAIVARGGSTSSSIDEISAEKLRKLPADKLEKLVMEETARQSQQR